MSARDDLFGDLPEYLAKGALLECHDLDVGEGEVIMSAGDDDPAMIYVLEGSVAVKRGGVEIDRSGPGQVIGEMALFRGVPRVAEIETATPTQALIVTREAYFKLVEANNPVVFRLERKILEQLGARLRRLDELVAAKSEGQTNPYYEPPKGLFDQLKSLFSRKEEDEELIERDIAAADVLGESHLFRGERYPLVEGIANRLEHFVWTTGQTLCEQGETGDAVYVIAEGRADVYVHTTGGRIHKLGTVGPGAAVGMTALVDDRPRSATVIATEQVDALELTKASFDALVAQDGQIQSALRRAIIRAFADQIDQAGAALVSLSSGDDVRIPANAGTEFYAE